MEDKEKDPKPAERDEKSEESETDNSYLGATEEQMEDVVAPQISEDETQVEEEVTEDVEEEMTGGD
jgi:hypothetical protein